MSFYEQIVLGMVGFSSCLYIFKSLQSKTYRSWLPNAGATLFAMLMAYLLIPEHVAAISLGFWLAIILLPSIAMKTLSQKMYSRNFSYIKPIVLLLKILHPFHNWNEYLISLKIIQLTNEGKTEEAETLIEKLSATDDKNIRNIKWGLRYSQGHWEFLLDEINAVDQHIPLDPTTITMKIRALGETSRLNEMVQYFEQSKELLVSDKSFFTNGLLFLFAFNGRKELVDSLCKMKPLSQMPKQVHTFWMATSEITTGEVQAGHARIHTILDTVEDNKKKSFEERIANPLPVSQETLSPESLKILEKEVFDFKNERTYDGSQATPTKSVVVLMLIAINVLVFIYEFHIGAIQDVMALFKMGGMFAPSIQEQNEWWRLLTATFLHYDSMHIGMNMLALYWLGPFVEKFIGKWRFIITYLGASVGSMGLAYVLTIYKFLPPNDVLIGASGGIMGLAGATGAIMLKGWKQDQAKAARHSFFSMLLIVSAQFVLDWIIPNVSMTGHLGGAALGFLITWIWIRRNSSEVVANQSTIRPTSK